jgi:hypothetical protein
METKYLSAKETSGNGKFMLTPQLLSESINLRLFNDDVSASGILYHRLSCVDCFLLHLKILYQLHWLESSVDMNKELKRTWKEAVMIFLKVLSLPEKHQPTSRPRINLGASRIRSRRANHYIATYGLDVNIMTRQHERVWKETIVAYFKVQ